MQLSGVESVTIELPARVPAAALAGLRVPAPLTVHRDEEGDGSASILVLEMRGLGIGRLPPRFDYREVLYRLAVTVGGAPGWLALRCDLDRPVVRALAAAIIRYPVRAASIDIRETADGALAFGATTDAGDLHGALHPVPGDGPAPAPPRRTFVVDRGRVLEVPWDERPAPRRARARVTEVGGSACEAVFGAPLAFAPEALVHRGRTHLCGPARRLPEH